MWPGSALLQPSPWRGQASAQAQIGGRVGSPPYLCFPTLLSTGVGMLCSSVTKSQIAVIFLAMIATLLPAAQLCGLTNPVPNDGSLASIIGNVYPTTYMLLISRGVFNKGLFVADLLTPTLILVAEIAVISGLGILLQRKQER